MAVVAGCLFLSGVYSILVSLLGLIGLLGQVRSYRLFRLIKTHDRNKFGLSLVETEFCGLCLGLILPTPSHSLVLRRHQPHRLLCHHVLPGPRLCGHRQVPRRRSRTSPPEGRGRGKVGAGGLGGGPTPPWGMGGRCRPRHLPATPAEVAACGRPGLACGPAALSPPSRHGGEPRLGGQRRQPPGGDAETAVAAMAGGGREAPVHGRRWDG